MLPPLGAGAPSAIACLGLHLATRARPVPPARAFRDRERVLEAHARGALGLDQTIIVDGRTSTAGRYLVAECLPPAYRAAAEAPWDATRGARVIERITRELHVEVAARAVEALEQLGRSVAERSGFSLARDDFAPPPQLDALIADAHAEAARIEREYEEGQITDGERYNRVHAVWAAAAASARVEARKLAPALDPLAACAASYPGTLPPADLRSIRGVIPTTAPGTDAAEMIGTPARGSHAHEYFLRCAEARRAALADGERDHEAAQLFRDLFAVLGDLEIVASDCGTQRGVRVRRPLCEPDAAGSLARRIEGRVTAGAVADPAGDVIAAAGALITPALARRFEAAGVVAVIVRDVRVCEARGGVCSRCFGLLPEDATWPAIGDGVGAWASETIAAAARNAKDQIFHIC